MSIANRRCLIPYNDPLILRFKLLGRNLPKWIHREMINCWSVAQSGMSNTGGEMANHLSPTQVITRSGRAQRQPQPDKHIISVFYAFLSMKRAGETGRNGWEHICLYSAARKYEQHVKECLPVVPLTSVSISEEREAHAEQKTQEMKWLRDRRRAITRKKRKSLVGISGNEEVWKLIPVERSRRAL